MYIVIPVPSFSNQFDIWWSDFIPSRPITSYHILFSHCTSPHHTTPHHTTPHYTVPHHTLAVNEGQGVLQLKLKVGNYHQGIRLKVPPFYPEEGVAIEFLSSNFPKDMQYMFRCQGGRTYIRHNLILRGLLLLLLLLILILWLLLLLWLLHLVLFLADRDVLFLHIFHYYACRFLPNLLVKNTSFI